MNNEKEIIASKPTVTVLPIVLLLTGIVELILTYNGAFGGRSSRPSVYSDVWTFTPPTSFVVIGYVIIAIAILLFFYMAGCEIRITDKLVCGKTAFSKRVDIPIDSISSVGKIFWLKGVVVASSSGVIRFMYLANAEEIYSALSNLIIARQSKMTNNIITQEAQSSADELKKYKDLLDSGIISQEEFDAKKKQLLGL